MRGPNRDHSTPLPLAQGVMEFIATAFIATAFDVNPRGF